MLELKRIFQTHQQAMDVYRNQLSKQMLYVETFEGFPKGTPAKVHLEIRETGQQIDVSCTVERLMGKKEAVETGFGQRPGLILTFSITPELVEPFRGFFAAPVGGAQVTQSARPSAVRPASQPVRPAQVVRPGQVVRPSVVRPGQSVRPVQSVQEAPQVESVVEESVVDEIPFSKLTASDPALANQLVDAFLALSETGSLFQLFNVRSSADRRQIRRVYNTVVRSLHPDAHEDGFSEALAERLGDCYQVFNEAYQVLSHPIRMSIYLEASKANGLPHGMSLKAYKKWQSDYRLRSGANIRMADELAQKAEEALREGNREEAAHHVKLALQYDPYNEAVRAVRV